MPMGMKEGHPELADAYHAITTASSSLKQYYLGKTDACWGYDNNKTELLGCKCGNRYCWPLLCKISIQGNKVTWPEFEQPHRDDWDYSHFEGFIFDKLQYLNEIEVIENA